MKTITLLLLAVFATLAVMACTPRPNDPAEFITLNKERELKLLGAWKLTTLQDGQVPGPDRARTLTFQNDGTVKMDLWEHQLVFKYEVMPDPDHLRLTWVSSTNPNDKPGTVLVQALVVNQDDLTLGGDHFKRIALASGATLTPSALANAGTTTPPANPALPSPQGNLPSPTSVPGSPGVVNARLGEPFVLHVRETGMLTDSTDQFGITFYNVTQDSRCPREVMCVWAGELRAQITFQKDGILHPPIIELTSNPGDPNHIREMDGYLVELVDVQPPASADHKIAMSEYAVTFRVTRGTETPVPAPTPGTNTISAVLDQPVTLKMFQTLELPDKAFRATLNGVLEESRCPRSVNCAQAGRAIVSFLLERNQRLAFAGLSTQPPDGRTRGFLQGFAIELLDVQPYPEALKTEIPAIKYSATVVVHKVEPSAVVKKNEGFALHVGETVTLADENVRIKLVSVTQDSRCPYMVACAVRGNAVVELLLTLADASTQTFILNEDRSKTNERIPDFGSYGMELVALAPYPRGDIPSQMIAPEEYEATLVVRKFAAPQGPAPTPTTVKPTSCLGLTRAQAAGILGEPVQELPAANVVIQAQGDDETFGKPFGVCGFLSAAQIPGESFVGGEPYELGHKRSHAVTAARLTGAKILELLRVVGIVRAANPDADETPYLILKTRLVAGDWDGMFETMRDLAGDVPIVHTEAVDSYGDEGLWLWRSANDNNYAALIVRDQSAFYLVEALLNKNIGEDAAKESLRTLIEKMIP